jgi:hypothetical protein
VAPSRSALHNRLTACGRPVCLYRGGIGHWYLKVVGGIALCWLGLIAAVDCGGPNAGSTVSMVRRSFSSMVPCGNRNRTEYWILSRGGISSCWAVIVGQSSLSTRVNPRGPGEGCKLW